MSQKKLISTIKIFGCPPRRLSATKLKNMDINLVMQAVSTVGFPIVCCGALGLAFYKMNIQHTAQIKELTENHRAEMNELKQALENNTLAVQKLCVMISGKEAE